MSAHHTVSVRDDVTFAGFNVACGGGGFTQICGECAAQDEARIIDLSETTPLAHPFGDGSRESCLP